MKCFSLLKAVESDFSNFRCLFEFTINPYNLGLFEETLKEANIRVGCTEKDFQFTLFHISENFYANKGLDSEYSNFAKNAHKEAAEIRKKLTFSLSSEYLLKRIYLSLIEPGLKNHLRCGAANNSIFLDPCLNVFPCISRSDLMGNLRDFNYSLTKLLRSDEAKEVSKKVKNCNNCWALCEASHSIVTRFPQAFYYSLKKQ